MATQPLSGRALHRAADAFAYYFFFGYFFAREAITRRRLDSRTWSPA